MNTEQIFIGNIRRCTEFRINVPSSPQFLGVDIGPFPFIKVEDELYKKDAILIKLKDGNYVDLENLNSFLDYIKLHKDIKRPYYNNSLILPTSARCLNALFVEMQSLRPYYTEKNQVDKISVYQLKKQIQNKR